MPFPLAHPAAVLPLRRYCPRVLSFPALVVGSLSPDAAYLFGEGDVGTFAHRLVGGVEFCLPVSLVMLGLFYLLRTPMLRVLPAAYRQALLPTCRRPLGPSWVLIVSLALGIGTHLLWDSFTHNSGWFVQHLSALQTPILSVEGRTARVCHLLWYGSSFAGVVWLFLAFGGWEKAVVEKAAGNSGNVTLWGAGLVGLSVVPIELAHHLVRGKLGLLLVALLCGLVAGCVVLRIGRAKPAPSAQETRGDERAAGEPRG